MVWYLIHRLTRREVKVAAVDVGVLEEKTRGLYV